MHRDKFDVQEEGSAHLAGAHGHDGSSGDGATAGGGSVEGMVEGGEQVAKRARARRLTRDGGGEAVRWGPAHAAGRPPHEDDVPAPKGKGAAVPKQGASSPRATSGVRFPSVRDGTGRKAQYGNVELCARLRVWRERVLLSQTELALRVVVSSPNISHYERGARAPSKEVCKRLRTVLCLTDMEYIQLLEWS